MKGFFQQAEEVQCCFQAGEQECANSLGQFVQGILQHHYGSKVKSDTRHYNRNPVELS